MKVLVCGGREFTDRWLLEDYLNKLNEEHEITLVINGGARGADQQAEAWAHSKQINYLTIPAKWNKYGKGAGFKRNTEMLEHSPDRVVAAPGGKGTAMMCDIAMKAGFDVEFLGETE